MEINGDKCTEFHAHLYFDEKSVEVARAVIDSAKTDLPFADVGHFHERLIGPHPKWSCEVMFGSEHLEKVLVWFINHRKGLDVFVHPLTTNGLLDHTEHVMWIGKSHQLDLSLFGVR